MKTNGKRIFSVLLSLLMVMLPCAALTAAAADTPAVLASGYCGGEGDGTNLTWKITSDGVLTVSGRGAMGDYTEIRESEMQGQFTAVTARPWDGSIYLIASSGYDPELLAAATQSDPRTLADMELSLSFMYDAYDVVRSVVVEENVTTVGAGAFSDLYITSVSLPSTLRSIGEMAFYETSLTSVDLPEGLVSIGPQAFFEVPLTSLVLPSTLQSIGARAFDYTRLHGVTVRGNALDAGALPVLCTYYRPTVLLTAAQYDTAYTLNMMANLLNYLNNDGVYGSWYAKQFEVWGYVEDGAGETYVKWWFKQHLFMLERFYGIHIEYPSYFGARDALIAEINRLLDSNFTAAQLGEQTGVTTGFTDAFCDAVKAYRAANGTENDCSFLYGKLLNEDQKIKYKLQTTSYTLEELLYRRRTELSELYAAVLAVSGEEVSDLDTAKAVMLAKLNADYGASYTEEDILVVYPTYQVNYAALNAAFNQKYGLTDIVALPLEGLWFTLEESTGTYLDMDIYPMPWYTVSACSETVLDTAAAAGVATQTLEHTWGEPVSVPATCTTIGVNVYTCIYCGAEHREYENALGHYLVPYDETQPTYDAHGYTAGVYCTQCDTWLSGHEVIHNTFGHREVLRQPTTEEEGQVIITCTVCGERGLYAIERLENTEPEEEPDPRPTFIEQVSQTLQKAVNSVVNWILRLIRWLGKSK